MTTPEATDPLIRTAPVERATVVGRYELVGVNGALLPVPLDLPTGEPRWPAAA